jgi:hypothetical protein
MQLPPWDFDAVFVYLSCHDVHLFCGSLSVLAAPAVSACHLA